MFKIQESDYSEQIWPPRVMADVMIHVFLWWRNFFVFFPLSFSQVFQASNRKWFRNFVFRIIHSWDSVFSTFKRLIRYQSLQRDWLIQAMWKSAESTPALNSAFSREGWVMKRGVEGPLQLSGKKYWEERESHSHSCHHYGSDQASWHGKDS